MKNVWVDSLHSAFCIAGKIPHSYISRTKLATHFWAHAVSHCFTLAQGACA